jgi:beta-aspartyl-peptidase (threonine type)
MKKRPQARFRSHVAKALRFFTILIALSGSQVATAGSSDADTKKAIEFVLDQQVAAWNRGDINGFMSGYWNSPELIYVGNTKVTRGWQTLLDRYEELSKASGGQIGTLELQETQITVLSKDNALVWGTYRVLQPGQDRKGLYTLVLRRFQAGWRTIYDRTSSEPLR